MYRNLAGFQYHCAYASYCNHMKLLEVLLEASRVPRQENEGAFREVQAWQC
jgi:hypothetical protein